MLGRALANVTHRHGLSNLLELDFKVARNKMQKPEKFPNLTGNVPLVMVYPKSKKM